MTYVGNKYVFEPVPIVTKDLDEGGRLYWYLKAKRTEEVFGSEGSKR